MSTLTWVIKLGSCSCGPRLGAERLLPEPVPSATASKEWSLGRGSLRFNLTRVSYVAAKYLKLTSSALKVLKPGQSIAEHGIVATRTKGGDTRYRIQTMVDGERIHRTIGTHSDGVRRETCEQALEVLRTRAREGRLELPKGRKLAPTFAAEAQRYLDQLHQGIGKGVDRKRQHLEGRLVPILGGYRFAKVPDLAIHDFVASRRRDGAKDSTINRELATLSHLFRSAHKWGWISEGSAPSIPRLREDGGRRVVLNQEEAAKLLQSAGEDRDPDIWLFVTTCMHTSMRHGEVRRIKWENIDLARQRIFIPHAKAGEREQPMTSELAATYRLVKSRRGADKGYVFVGGAGSKTGYRHTFRKAFQRSVIRAELDPQTVTPHVLRHTAITRLVKAGVDLPTIQRVSGHKTLAMVIRYTHVDGAHIDAAMKALE